MDKKQLIDDLNKEINNIQENIDSRGEVLSKLIQDGLKEIEIRDNLRSLKRKIEEK